MTQVSSVWIRLPVERVAAWASVSQSDQHHFSLQHQYVVDLSNPLVPFPLDFSDDVILSDRFREFLVLFVCLLVCCDLSQWKVVDMDSKNGHAHPYPQMTDSLWYTVIPVICATSNSYLLPACVSHNPMALMMILFPHQRYAFTTHNFPPSQW